MRGSWAFQMRRCSKKTTSDGACITASVKNQLLTNINGSMLSNPASPGVSSLCEIAQPCNLLRLWQPLSFLWEQTCWLQADSLEVGGSTRPYSKKRADFCYHSVSPLHILQPLLSINNIFNNCRHILKMCCIIQLHTFQKLTPTLWWIAWQSKI